MKKIFNLILVAIMVSACSKPIVVNKPKPLPPGQAKKVTGSQSAKEYAPGQQKKNTTGQKAAPAQKTAPGQQKKKN
jgi:hypothetical protein